MAPAHRVTALMRVASAASSLACACVSFAGLVSPSDFLPPTFGCDAFVPRSPQNLTLSEFCDRGVDADMRQAAAIGPSDSAGALWARPDRAIVDRAAAVPLVDPRALVFVSERVGNHQFHPQWTTLLDQLWVR